jgi:protein-tyrosine kinase
MSMSINEKPPQSGVGSLIERASQVYGFRDSLLKQPSPPRAPVGPQPVVTPRMPVEEFVRPVVAPVAQPVAAPMAPAPAPVAAAPVAPPAPVVAAPVAAPVAPVPVQSPYASPPIYAPKAKGTAQVDVAGLRHAGFIVPGSPPSMLSEEFRLIKRQLLLQAFGGQNVNALDRGRQILVCSAQPNEGKSFCSVNLALSMVTETDIEVLLIDADVAKPEVLSILGLPAGPGLMDALADPRINPEELIMHTSIPGLSILPAGRQTSNDTELLASDRSQEVIEALARNNPRRVMIFDSAPALAASPASVLALNVGQIVLVVRADVTPESALRESLAMLEGNARIQLLLNSVTFSGSNRKFGYYYGLGEK